MQKIINAKNVTEYVKKVNRYIKNYKVTSNRNVNKETNQTKKKYKSATNIEMCVKIYKNMYIYKHENMQMC